MRHFRPGENVIAIEAVLQTELSQSPALPQAHPFEEVAEPAHFSPTLVLVISHGILLRTSVV
jgi:hypothetical protein